MDIKKNYTSPNFNHRRNGAKIQFIILHYTDMEDAKTSLEFLCSDVSQVSCHYLIDINGDTYQIVEDEYRAWHAGKSYWQGIKDMNSYTIGIELQNKGHGHDYTPFPQQQIENLIQLLKILKKKYNLYNTQILAHSDIAPLRKKDPGELFRWDILEKYNLSYVPNTQKTRKNTGLKPKTTALLALEISTALYNIGYNVRITKYFPKKNRAALVAFCRHFVTDCFKKNNNKFKIDNNLRIALQKTAFFYNKK
jgi:N-acetylmuramoyl-L-alanine amidase